MRKHLAGGTIALLTTLLGTAGCALVVHGQHVPEHALVPRPADFVVPPGVAVLHYYGAGGWGIKWGETYVLAAPYFTNHGLPTLLASRASSAVQVVPDVAAVRAGFAGTPVGETNLILIGHGHVDHAGDVPAFFGEGLITGKPTLIADRSTTNLLAPMLDRFGCVAPVDYGNAEASAAKCAVPRVRITPIHSAHAPHLRVKGVEVAAFGGFVKEPRTTLPATAEDYKLGNTWAYLIDLLDEQGEVAFRIHYVDAAASPPHAIVPRALLAGRDVDVHIGCVPGFELSEDYPDGVLRHHNVRYVLAAHWEDFFQARTDRLTPLREVVDGESLERFVDIVEKALPAARGVVPLNKSAADCAAPRECGPHGAAWSLPVPGETFQFAAGPQTAAAPLADTVGSAE
jgi:hypothetical protein